MEEVTPVEAEAPAPPPAKFVPTIHYLMIVVTVLIMHFSMIMYFFAPPGKSEAFLMLMTTAMGALFGKFTNGFKTGKDKDPNA